MTFKLRLLLAALLCSLLPVPARALEPGEELALAVAPYLDDQAVFVAHIDLARADLAAIERFLVAAVQPPNPRTAATVAEGLAPLRAGVDALKKARARNLYVVVSLADFPSEPPLIVPVPDGADARAIAACFPNARQIGAAVVGADPGVLDRLAALKPARRPELSRAFAAAGDVAARGALLPTPDNRKVIEQLLPTLPAAIGGGPSTTLTRGLGWAAVGVTLQPAPAVTFTIQSESPERAGPLRALIARSLALLAALPEARPFIPDPEKLTPSLAGDRLTLTLDAAMLKALAAPLFADPSRAPSSAPAPK